LEKILIIEDDINIAELEKDYLELSGFQIRIESDGSKGLDEAIKSNYDVLIVDLMLPNLDGYEIVRSVRAKYEIPIIIVSARNEDIDKIRALGLGADDYIQKPFSPAELVARIRSHIARYNRLRKKEIYTNILSTKGLEVNLTSSKVFVNMREVQLTKKEYELLVFLMSKPNEVFSKEQLINSIWRDEVSNESTSLPVHIRKIRKKIEKYPDNPIYIETIWGKGYRFKQS
jgi:DNA-binding response OmpR family regulator